MTKLIGLPGADEPNAGFLALPLMRGFPCPVMSPMVGGAKGSKPMQGVGVGMSSVPGKGAMFFLSVHGDQDDTLVAQLDYARYQRLCELLAAVGKQALMIPGVEEPSADDPLAALGVAHEALEKARLQFLKYEQSHLAKYPPWDLEHLRGGIVDVPSGRDAYDKALVNAEMADAMRDALAVVAKALRLPEEDQRTHGPESAIND